MDAMQPSSQFLWWRWSVYLSMFLGWSCYQLVRLNFPCTVTSLVEHQGFSRSDVGKISSCFAMAYGISKFLGSIMSDYASPRLVFSRGLILAGMCSLVFPLAHTVTLACVVWFAEGVMQGCGWPPCVILLKAWYPPSQIGRWWGVLGSAANIVSTVLPLLVIYITSTFHWSMSYTLFGLCSIAVGLLVNITIKDTPEDIGLTGFHHTEKRESSDSENSSNWFKVFFFPDLWAVSIVYAILYLTSNSCTYWSRLYFVQEAKMSETRAAACFSIYQVGAMFGNLSAGYLSDFFITPRTLKCPCPRSPFLLGVSVLTVIFLHLLRTSVGVASSEGWVSVLMFMLGYLVTSGVVVVGLTAMEVVPKHMVGSAHGLACAVAQVGSFLAGWPFTLVLETRGWSVAYGVVECCLVFMIAVSSYLVFIMRRSHKKLKTS